MRDPISLNLSCPRCGKSLNDVSTLIDDYPSIKLLIRTSQNEGSIWLSSVYGSYEHKSTCDVPPNEIAVFSCPHCAAKLTSRKTCDLCDAPMVDFHLPAGGLVSICSRAGCKKHSVEFEDIETAINYFYNTYDAHNFNPGQV